MRLLLLGGVRDCACGQAGLEQLLGRAALKAALTAGLRLLSSCGHTVTAELVCGFAIELVFLLLEQLLGRAVEETGVVGQQSIV
jgi:hypothetical protein